MTKFEELMDAIASNKRKKNKNSEIDSHDADYELQLAGSEATKAPLLLTADDDSDMDLIDQLYFKPKHKPLTGEFAEKWD
jgi:hypothetical protein